MDRKLLLYAALAGLLIAAGATAVFGGSSDPYTITAGPNGVVYDAPGADGDAGPTITVQEDIVQTTVQFPFSEDGTTIYFYDDHWVHSTTNVSANLSGIRDQWTELDSVLGPGTPTVEMGMGSKPRVIIEGEPNEFAFSELVVNDGTEDLRYTSGTAVNVSLQGYPSNISVGVASDSGSMLDTANTGSGNTLEYSLPAGSYNASLVQVTSAPPELSGFEPPDGTTLENGSVVPEVSVNVSDPDFGQTWGDQVNVSIYDYDTGEEIHNETLSTNSSVSTNWTIPMGTSNWSVFAEDSYGYTAAAGPFEIGVPNQIELRDEQSLELLNDTNATVTFYSGDDETSITRTTSDGVINLSGLAADELFFAEANATGYYSSTAVIESIVEQRTIYLTSRNASVVNTTFVIDDRTGNFGPSSVLLIEGSIDVPGETDEYRVIAGDEIGADERLSVRLIEGKRYQLTIDNREGDRRSLGSYVADESRTVTLTIGELEWSTPEDDAGYTFTAEKINGGSDIELRFNATGEPADQLDVTVAERFDGDAVLYEDSVTDTSSWRVTIPLNESQQRTAYRVEYRLERDGETVQGSILISGDRSVSTSLPVEWMTGLSMIAIVLVSALFTGRMSAHGGFATVTVAGLLMILGWAPIPTAAWFVAALIAAGGYVRAYEGATP